MPDFLDTLLDDLIFSRLGAWAPPAFLEIVASFYIIS